MAICELCPPDSRDIPENEMAEHLRALHPELREEGALRLGESTILRDTSVDPGLDSGTGLGDWHE